MHKCLDVKSQRWAHARDIFVVEFFQYGSLPGVVKTEKQQSHLLLLLPVLPYYSEQPHKKVESSGEVNGDG